METSRPGADYASEIIRTILITEQTLPAGEKTEIAVLNHWFDSIRDFAETAAIDALAGKREDAKLSEEEVISAYEVAVGQHIQDLLNGLVDKDLVDVSINENGDLLYGITDKGKSALENGEI